MITGTRPHILDAELFAAAMARAMRSVVRIGFKGQSTGVSTGWLLTPDLVLLPDYAIGPGSPGIVVQGIGSGGERWEVGVTGLPERLGLNKFENPDDRRALPVALLSLAKPVRAPRLEFAASIPPAGTFVSLLSFVRGGTKLCLSPGTLLESSEPVVSYDADTEPGSSGAPVFNEQWRVIGLHARSQQSSRFNQGVTVTALLGMLQESRRWAGIAKVHRLAHAVKTTVRAGGKSSAVPVAGDAKALRPALVKAALVTSFAPSQFSAAEREVLGKLVIDPDDKRWALQPSERVKVLSAGLDRLRPFAPRKPLTPGDHVIQRILAGPPYDLSGESEESLSWWIQAASWFAGIAPGLPTPADVTRELEDRRVRSRLRAIAGEDFEGREDELGQLRKWFKQEPPVPFSLTGIGGVGKSSLVARFALTLPQDTLLLWLDFDRADLAPDNAASIVSALGEQAAVQLDNFTAPVSAEALGKGIQARLGAHPPLLVLDSFEVAQYAERYDELWPVLDVLSRLVPSLRVIVSGRAPVSGLKLNGREARTLHLTGLKEPDAKAWLERHGIKGASVIRRIWELPPRGLPLNLHLAHHLVEAGGRVTDLPRELPPEIVAGFLYDRILNRVRDRAVKPVAQAALVLRRLTPQIVTEVLGGLVKLPPGDPAEWFGTLSREASLVEGSGVLTLRHEVRSSALQFLEQADAKLVRAVDQRAAEWYATQKTDSPEIAAELVYHRLRLGDVKGAQAAWRDGCGAFLQYAEENLTGAARKWLSARKGSGVVSEAPVEVWEQEAAERIRNARARGHDRTVHGILGERRDRGAANSALAFHEAYELRAEGKREAALAHLENAGEGEGPVFRERAVLRGLLLAELGRHYEADLVLRRPEAEEWSDRRQGNLERLLLFAGRLRAATDIDAEEKVLARLAGDKGHDFFVDWVSPIDIVLPDLAREFERDTAEQVTPIKIPAEAGERERFGTAIEKLRRRTVLDEPAQMLVQRGEVSRGGRIEPGSLRKFMPAEMEQVLDCAWRRWWLAAISPRLGPVLATLSRPGSPYAWELSGSAALFVGFGRLKLETPAGRLDDLALSWLGGSTSSSSGSLRRAAIQYHLSAPHPLVTLVDRFAGKEAAS